MMPATPAWPPSSLPRLFVGETLRAGAAMVLDGAPANYLGTVLRLAAGAEVKLFDDETGEWLARVSEVAKRRVTVVVERRLRPREPVPDLWLLFAPVKRGPIDFLVEKATELGVDRLLPVTTRRTVVDRLNLERLRANMVEAAEQCERTALPRIEATQKLEALLGAWPEERALFFADETGGAPLAAAAAAAPAGPAAILIGPEGGFTQEERARVRALPAARAVSLGPRILRAETAAAAAVAVWMAAVGDWTGTVAR